ncbi:hypothetical protein NHF50_08055 [Flavobacterium sp. NRK F10]|uniref:hypothetical protein n=1 Tax=Flavobacterium sp. NRK F10 TaxID=2954931 RepID=UPI0020916970|nr:hypothetical protein [Flavobacterium sp. NRK F10]MCO6174998.1 hypothetical protein [Flavobacterium sp. NRK F10]
MNKIITLLVLTSSFFAFSQEADSVKITKSPKLDFYWGIGMQVNSFKLNDKLRASGAADIKETMPEFLLGANIFGEQFSGDIEFGFLYSTNRANNTKSKLLGVNARLRVHYNLIKTENIALTTGLNLSATGNNVDVYAANNVINLNDLDPMNNSGHISLRNQIFYVGPSASFYAWRNKAFKLRLNIAYEFAFTNGKWKSDYADVHNTVKEIGNNRFILGLIIQ